MKLAIVIGVLVIVVAVAVLVAVRSVRSRSERSDWLGELSDIRLTSLGDDEEVTGAMEAVTIVEEVASNDGDPVEVVEPDRADPNAESSRSGDSGPVEDAPESEFTSVASAEKSDADGESADTNPDVDEVVEPDSAGADAEEDSGDADPDPETDVDGEPDDDGDPDKGPSGLGTPAPSPDLTSDQEPAKPDDRPASSRPETASPARTVSDAGALFNEYRSPGSARLRIEVTDPTGLRVMAADDAPSGTGFAVDLPRGVLWFRSEQGGTPGDCSARIPAGWVTATGVLAVLAEDPGWSYVMCLEGTASIRSRSGGHSVRLTAGQLGRLRADEPTVDVVEVGAEALESEGVVRRQRRLDAAFESEG